MEQRHRDILRNNWVFLMENLTLDYLLPILFQNRILSEDLIEQIKSENTSKLKNYAFLTILQRRGSKAFDACVQALVESDQNHVAERLMQQSSSSMASTTRTSQGNVLRHPEEPSNNTSASTLEDDFALRLAIKEEENEKRKREAGNEPSKTSQIQSNSPKSKTSLPRQASSDPLPPPNHSVQSPTSPPLTRRSSVEHSIRQFPSIFDIAVKTMEALPLDFSVRLGTGEIYPNFSKPKGLCMIVNNREFEKSAMDLGYRKGSDRDTSNLAWLFEQIG